VHLFKAENNLIKKRFHAIIELNSRDNMQRILENMMRKARTKGLFWTGTNRVISIRDELTQTSQTAENLYPVDYAIDQISTVKDFYDNRRQNEHNLLRQIKRYSCCSKQIKAYYEMSCIDETGYRIR
jgi:hypothetical protein